MAGTLADRKCLPCNGETPPVPASELPGLLAELKDWAIEDGRLVRILELPDFVSAVRLVNAITPLAEEAGHHPDLRVSYGRLRVELTTHAIGALSDNDFILAAQIDRLLTEG